MPVPVIRRVGITMVAGLLAIMLLLQGASFFLTRASFGERLRVEAEKQLGLALQSQVRIGYLRSSLFNKVKAGEIVVVRDGREVIRAGEVTIQYSLWRLLAGRLDPLAALSRIELVHPEIRAEMLTDGTFDLAVMFSGQSAPAGPLALRAIITFRGGAVSVRGLPQHQQGIVRDLDGYVSFRQYPRLRVLAKGTVDKPSTGRFVVDGTVHAETMVTRGRADLAGIPLESWLGTGLVPMDIGDLKGTVDVTIDGGYDGQNLLLHSGRLSWANGYYEHPDLPGPVRDVVLEASYSGDRLSIRRGQARIGATRLNLRGGIRKPLALEQATLEDLTVEAAKLNWADWSALVPLPDWKATGIFDVAVVGNGALLAPVLNGRVAVTGGSIAYLPANITVTGINGEMVLEPDRFRLDHLEGIWEGASFSLSGKAWDWNDPRVELIVNGSHLDLGRLSAIVPGMNDYAMAGQAGFNVIVTGLARDPLGTAVVRIPSGTVQGEKFGDLRLNLDYRAGRVSGEFKAEAVKGNVYGWGTWNPFAAEPQMTAEVQVRHIDVAQAVTAFSWDGPALAGSVSGQFLIRAKGNEPLRVYGTAALTDGLVAGQQLGPVEMAFNYHLGIFTLESFSALYGKGIVSGHGSIDSDGRLQLQGTGRRLDFQGLLEQAGLPASGLVDLRFNLGGTLTSPSGHGTLTISQASYGGFRLGTLQAEAEVKGTNVTLTQARLIHPDHRVQAGGVLDWASGRITLNIDADGFPINSTLAALGFKGLPPITGRVSGAAAITGTLVEPVVNGRVSMGKAVIGPESLDGLEAVFSWDGKILSLSGAELRKADGYVRLNGTLDHEGRLDGKVRVAGIALDRVESVRGTMSDVAGTVSLDGTISGSVQAPLFRGILDGRGITLSQTALGQVTGVVEWADERIYLRDFRMSHEKQRVVASGWIAPLDGGELDLRLDCNEARITDLLRLSGAPFANRASGLLTGYLQVKGPLSRLEGGISAGIASGRVSGLPLDAYADARFILDLSDGLQIGQLDLNQLRLWHQEGTFQATGRFDAAGGTDMRITARQFEVQPLMTLLGDPEALTGTLQMDLRLTGYPDEARLNGSLALQSGKLAGIDYDWIRGTVRADSQALYLSDVQFERKGDVALASGTIPLDDGIRRALSLQVGASPDPVSLSLDIRAEGFALDWLPVLIDPNLRVSGARLNLRTHISGSLTRPDLRGAFSVEPGVLEVPGLPLPVTAIEGKGRFEGDRIVFDEFRGDFGVSRVTAGGSLTFVPFAITRFDLWGKSNKLVYGSIPFTGTARGTVTYRGPAEAPVLGGEVWVSEARVSVAPAVGGGGAGAPLPPVGLDLAVHIADLRLKQEMTVLDLDIPVEGDVRVRGTLAEPRLQGDLSARRGTIVAYRNAFQLVEGRAEFSESRGFIPYIRLMARKPLKGGQVFLKVEGEAGPDLRLEFESYPPMTPEEIFAALDLPDVLRGNGLRVQDILDEGVYMVGKAAFDTLGRSVAQLLNVDEFSLVPRGTSFLSPEGLELRVGKFVTPSLYLNYTSFLDQQLTHVLAMDYYLSPWSVLSMSYSTTGDYSMGLSFRMRF